MADLGTTTSTPAPPPPAEDATTHRRVRRRRSLPGGRAVAGAFLITAAAVGVFAAYLNATAAPSDRWLVAAQDVTRGTVIEASMLDEVAMDVPAEHQSALVEAGNLDAVVGRVALGPLRAGDLLQDTTVLTDAPPSNASTFTFSVSSSRVALQGDLSSGDTVDIVATYDDTTMYVARDVELRGDPAAGDAGTSLTIAADSPDVVLAVANALDVADVFVLRSPPEGAGDGDLPPPFRASTRTSGNGGS